MKRINDFKLVVLFFLLLSPFLLFAQLKQKFKSQDFSVLGSSISISEMTKQNNVQGQLKSNNNTIAQSDTSICKGSAVLLSAYPVYNRSEFTYKGFYNGKNYYLSKSSTDWLHAKEKCEIAGGHLVCLEDKKEYDFLSSIMPDDITYSIGLWQNKKNPQYSEPLGGWEWINNQPFTFSSWGNGEPNEYNVGQDFAVSRAGKWDDANPFTFFVMEATKIDYKWSTGDTTSSITVNPEKTTTYYIETTDGITVNKDSITINVINASFNPFPDTLILCEKNKSLDANTGYKTYNWNYGANTQTLLANASGKYIVTVTSNEGCTLIDSVYLKLVNSKILQRDTAICQGGTVLLAVDSSYIYDGTLLVANKIAYKWSTGDTSNFINVSPQKTTTYYVEATDGTTLCKDSVTIYVNNSIYNPYPDTLSLCGENKILDAGNGYKNYSWNNGSNTQTILANTSGKYIVTVTNNGGCTFSDSIYLNLIYAKILQKDTTVCQGVTVLLSADTAFSYKRNLLLANKIAYKWSTGDTTSSINVTPQKTTKYYLEVTNGTTVCKDSITLNVNIVSFNPFPDTLSLCGESKLLDAGNGLKTYSWNNGANIQTLQAKSSGKFTVSVTNNEGCNLSDSIFLKFVKAKILQKDTTICHGVKVSLSVDTSLSYKLNLPVGNKIAYKWSTGDTSISINVTPQKTTTYYLEATNGTTVCTDSITLTVNIASFNPFQDTLSLCGESKLLDAGNGFKTYSWNNGANTQTLLAKSSGKFTVSVTNNEGCNLSDSIFLKFVKAKILQKDTTICQGVKVSLSVDTSLSYKLNLAVGNKIAYKWSTGDTSISTNVTPQKTTTYYLEATNGTTVCKDSITINVNQIDTSLIALDPIIPCNNTIAVRLKAGNASSYKWLKDNTPIINSNSNIYTVTSAGIYRVVVTNFNGCADTSRAINIELNAKPIASFSLNSTSQCLLNNSFITTNTSTLTSGTVTYNWNFGNGITSNSISPTIVYNASGIYTIKLVAISEKSCLDSITKTITVLAQPPTPLILGSSDLCIGNSVTLSTNGTQSLQWYKNNVILNGQTTNSLTVNQSGDYTVVSSNGIGCQSTSAIKSIVENALPIGSINIPTNTVICAGSSTQLVATGGATYQWIYNNNPVSGGLLGTFAATQPGVYTVDIISAKGCVSRSQNSINLTVIQKPEANFIYASNCTWIPLNFTNTSIVSNSGPIQYKWNLGNGITSMSQNFNYTFTTPTNVNAKLVVSPLSCPQLADSITKNIFVENSPLGIKYEGVNAVENKPLQLQARTFGIKYLWSPSTNLSSVTDVAPIYNGKREQLYKISITSKSGCTTIDTLLVRIFKDKDIHVPTGFSPDNDGYNDKLYPMPVGIREMKTFKVFNRWGIMVFDNKSANSSTGWDGFYVNMPQPMDTYSWIAQGFDDDGNLISKTGHVILIR